ncbi:hypothetical protein V8D89_001852 [Ganoderma adspersum]
MTSVHAPLKPISNGTTATVLPTRPPPVQMLPSKTSTPVARSCILCHRNLTASPNSTLRWCELCRQKQGEHPKLGRRGPRPASVSSPSIANTRTPAAQIPTPHADTDVMMVDATGGSSTSASPSRSKPGAMKRKADVMDSEELPAEDRSREDAALPAVQPKEYQTGKDLLDQLSRDVETSRASRSMLSRPQYVNFHGSYTIVMDPEVRGERRVKHVVDELRQSSKLRFGTLVKSERKRSCGGHARTFWCACDPPPQPPKEPTHFPTTQDAPPIRTQSTLVGWLAQSQSREKFDDETLLLPPPGCGGTITVYAVTDFSHPLWDVGVDGQKVVVDVRHPGRDFKHVPQWYI